MKLNTEYSTTEREPNDYPRDEDIIEDIVADTLWLYVPPIILILGTFGNLLSALIWSRRVFREKPISVYFLALAFVDSLALYTGLVRHWITALTGDNIRDQSSPSCKIHVFLSYWSITLASWVLVALTIDRLFHIKKSHFARRWFTHKTALALVASFAVMCVSVDCHFFISFDLVLVKSQNSSDNVYVCTRKKNWGMFMDDVWPWIDFVFYSACPSIILLVCNSTIIAHVMTSPFASLTRTRHSRFNTMTAILLCISMAFLILTTPSAIFFIMQYLWVSGNPQTLAKSQLFYTVSSLLSYINNAANFIFYCASGRQFRNELKHMFHAKKIFAVQETDTRYKLQVPSQSLFLSSTMKY